MVIHRAAGFSQLGGVGDQCLTFSVKLRDYFAQSNCFQNFVFIFSVMSSVMSCLSVMSFGIVNLGSYIFVSLVFGRYKMCWWYIFYWLGFWILPDAYDFKWWQGAIHLWRPHRGWREGQAQVDGGRGLAPCGCPHRKLKLESAEVILSSSHAKKLASFIPEFRLWTE